MFTTQPIEMALFVGVVIFQPHHTRHSIDTEGHFGWHVAAELFATSIHVVKSTQWRTPKWRIQWAMRASIPRLLRCERSALPTELIALSGSNNNSIFCSCFTGDWSDDDVWSTTLQGEEE